MQMFKSKQTTKDGRLTTGETYHGEIVKWPKASKSGMFWRVRIRDNRGELMTFDPQAFQGWSFADLPDRAELRSTGA